MLGLLQTFVGVLQKKICTYATFKETTTNYMYQWKGYEK